MSADDPVSRRTFLAASSFALSAGQGSEAAAASEPPPPVRLALHGGEKAVTERLPKRVRFGKPERDQLDRMIGQDSLFYWKGPQTTLLTERFRKVCPLPHVMSCSSGTAALHIAVAAAGIGPGDEVITTPITDMGTVIGVLFQQGVPVFADLGRDSYNLDPTHVARSITPRTRAIIAVHLAGNPCDLDALRDIADRHRLVLIEDCAQAWGARHDGKPIGMRGHLACFSFQDSKHITCGDGGIVASADASIGPRLQRFGDKGYDRLGRSGLFEVFATNYRMSEPQAAVAAAQLERLESIVERRSRLGNLLNAELEGVAGIERPRIRAQDRGSYWFFMFRVRPDQLRCDRSEFVEALAAEGVPASAGYIPVPLYGNPIFQQHSFFAGRWPIKEMGLTAMDYQKASCPEAVAILKTCVRITLHEAMSEGYVRSLAAGIRKVAGYYAT